MTAAADVASRASLTLLASAAPVPSVLLMVGLTAPALLAALLAVAWFSGRPLAERTTGWLVRGAYATSFVSFVAVGFAMLGAGIARLPVRLGTWYATQGHPFVFELLVDRLSLPYAMFTTALCGVIGAFAYRYLHREPGYGRFMLLLSVFSVGMLLVVLGGRIEMIFAGWEFVGLSSSLLVAFFHDRPLAARNGLRTFTVYRLSDVGLLLAAVAVVNMRGTGSLGALFGSTSWPGGHAAITDAQCTLVALLVFASVIGKSALVPLSGWLPRAMEGPTPSSAIFYGALSVHAGAYLLLRFGPVLDRSVIASTVVVAVGLATALYASTVGRVQTDIKSALAFASMTQVGIIVAEIGVGLRFIAVAHIVGHASMRALQFLRAPSLLHDLRATENAIGGHVAHTGVHLERWMGPRTSRWLFRFALERGYLDAWIDRWLVRPFFALVGFADEIERRWLHRVGLRTPTTTSPDAMPSSPPPAHEESGDA